MGRVQKYEGCVCALRSWDVRLAALKSYYGQPTGIFPFAYINPGGFLSNVTFWLNALKDYQHGEASQSSLCICSEQA